MDCLSEASEHVVKRPISYAGAATKGGNITLIFEPSESVHL